MQKGGENRGRERGERRGLMVQRRSVIKRRWRRGGDKVKSKSRKNGYRKRGTVKRNEKKEIKKETNETEAQ